MLHFFIVIVTAGKAPFASGLIIPKTYMVSACAMVRDSRVYAMPVPVLYRAATQLLLHHTLQRAATALMSLQVISSVPHDVLVGILQYVGLQDRLQHCALVSTAWHKAAAAATAVNPLLATCRRSSSAESLQEWLQRHGQQLQGLEIHDRIKSTDHKPTYLWNHLPCSQLRSLSVHGGVIQLGPSAAGGRGLLAHAQHLTSLLLAPHLLNGGKHALGVLEHLTRLQRLEVALSCIEEEPGDMGVLSHLINLTCLTTMYQSPGLNFISCLA